LPPAPIVLDDAVIRVLGEVSLFSGLTRMQLIWLLSAVTRFDVPANGLFFDEGEAGDKLYVLIVGSAVVEKANGGSWHTLATLRPGETFGEMAVVDGLPRSARVRATVDSVALGLNRMKLEGSAEVAVVVYRNIAIMQTLRLRSANQRANALA